MLNFDHFNNKLSTHIVKGSKYRVSGVRLNQVSGVPPEADQVSGHTAWGLSIADFGFRIADLIKKQS